MSWYLYSILTAFSFTGMVLCTRYLGNKGFSSKQILLFLFLFAFLGFLVINIGTINTIWDSEFFLDFIIIMTIVSIFAVIGNWADFTAVIKAPNPGFAGTIKSSNVFLISVIAFLIFGSSFSLIKLMGMFFIIGGIAALIIEKKDIFSIQRTERRFLRWDVLAIIGALSFTVAVLGIKKVSQIGFSPQEIALFVFGFNFLAFAILSRKDMKNYLQDRPKLKSFLPIVFLAATFSFIANILGIKGIAISPNPGYHESIKNTQILFVTLLSVPLLGADLNKQKLLGVVAVLIGIIILVI